MRGWRGRFALVCPDDGVNDDEFWLYLPDGVNLLFARFTTASANDPISPDMVDQYAGLDTLREAAGLVKITRPSVVGFGCNSCSFLRGRGFDIEQAAAMGEVCGCPGTTISTGMIQALRLFGVTTVSMVAPYPRGVTERLIHYLREHGISVAAWQTAGLETEWQIGNTPPGYWYDQARQVDRPEAEALIVACGGTRTAEMINALEADTGKPVVTAPAVLIWHGLQLMSVDATRTDRGRLFAEFGRAFATHGIRQPTEAL